MPTADFDYICTVMKKLILSLVLACSFCCIASAQAEWTNYRRYAEANAVVTVKPKAVFMGDSVTDNWAAMDPAFFSGHNFLGRGIGGQVTSQMVLRFRNDVIAHHPKYVVILGGINDIAQNHGPIDVEDTFGNIVTMVELAKANRIKPIVCLLLPTSVISWRSDIEDPLSQINKFNELLTAYAKAHHIPVVEYMKDIDKSSGSLPTEYSKDSIHPNLDGYKIMEQEILKYIK